MAPFGRSERLLAAIAVLGLLAWGWQSGVPANFMLRMLEQAGGPTRVSLEGTAAIVVLGGRIDRAAKAAELHRASGVPLYSAGADIARALRDEYRLQPRWVDTVSVDTETNAAVAACVLLRRGTLSIALVTDPWHMPRARMWFTYYGFEVVPARSALTRDFKPDSWWRTPRDPEEVGSRRRGALHEIGGIVDFWVARASGRRLSCSSDGVAAVQLSPQAMLD